MPFVGLRPSQEGCTQDGRFLVRSLRTVVGMNHVQPQRAVGAPGRRASDSWVHLDVLVVPGLNAGVVARRAQCRAGGGELGGISDLALGTGRAAGRRDEDTLPGQADVGAVLDHGVEPVAARVECRPADLGGTDVSGRADPMERPWCAAGVGDLEAVVRGVGRQRAAAPPHGGQDVEPPEPGTATTEVTCEVR